MKTQIARCGAFLFFVLIFIPRPAAAQSFEADLKRMYETMISAESLWMEMETVGNKYDGSAPFTSRGVMKLQGGLMYVEMYNLILFSDNNWQVMVDKSESEIYVKPARHPQKPADLVKNFVPAMNEQWENLEEATMVTHADGSRGYLVKNPTGMFAAIELYFDAGTGLLRRIIYHYHTEERDSDFTTMEVNFTKLEVNPALEPSTFDISRLLIRSGESWKAAKEFESFSVVAQ